MSKSSDESEPKVNDKFITMSENGNSFDQEQNSESAKKANTTKAMQNAVNRVKESIDKRYKLIIAILSILLLIFFIVILIVSAVKTSCSSALVDYCSTPACLTSASAIVASVNTSISPCENFYSYSCDGWLNKHHLPLNKGRFNLNEKIRRKINKELRYYIDLIPTKDPRSVEAKLKRFYDVCIDANAQAITYFLDAINEKLNGWHMIREDIFTTWDFSRALSTLITDYDVDVLFRVSIDVDHTTSNLPIIKIEPANLGLPVKYYFDPQYKPFVDAYKTYMEEFLKQISSKTTKVARTFAEDMFNFEKRLAEFTPLPNQWLNETQMYKKYRVRDLGSLIKRIEFLDLLQRYYVNANISDKTVVLLAFEEYFRSLSNVVTSADSKTLNNYLIWRFAMRFMRYLPKEYIALHNDFTQIMNGVEKPVTSDHDERWELCVETTMEFFHLAMADLYIKHQPDYRAVKEDVRDIINNLIVTLVSSVTKYNWIQDKQTEEKIIAKIQNTAIDVAFPHTSYTPEMLAKYYLNFDVQVVFFNNIERAIVFRKKKMTETLKGEWPIDWPLKLLDVNGVYKYAGNHLYIAAGSLHSPFYDLHHPLPIKYGSIGFEIASQLLRSLNIYGITYNENGISVERNLFVTMDSELALNRSTSCLERQLQNALSKTMLDSQLVVTQTYTDIGALKLVHDTYNRIKSGDGEILPGISATSEQLVFISFAQTQCETIRPKYKVAKYSLLTTLPGQQRVERLFANYKKFSQTFECSNDKASCQVW